LGLFLNGWMARDAARPAEARGREPHDDLLLLLLLPPVGPQPEPVARPPGPVPEAERGITNRNLPSSGGAVSKSRFAPMPLATPVFAC